MTGQSPVHLNHIASKTHSLKHTLDWPHEKLIVGVPTAGCPVIGGLQNWSVFP